MFRRLILAFALISVLLGAVPARPAAAATNPMLAITVAGTAGEPVQGARVELLAPGVGIAASTRTDRKGWAGLAVPPGDSFWIRVWAQGYAVVDQPWVPLADGYNLHLDLTAQAGSVAGVVTGLEGLPLEGAVVTAWQEGQGQVARAQTNGQGTFHLRNLLAPGPYVVQVEARGYQPYVSENPINITAGVEQRLDVAMTPAGGLVSGQVVSARSGRPLAGARVEALRQGWGTIATAQARADGTFDLNLPAAEQAEYQLRVWADGHDVLTTEPFALATGEWRSFQGPDRLALSPLYAEIWGILLNDAGEGVAGVTLELQRSGVGTIARTTTDADGFYSFSRVVAGDYRVRALPDRDWAPTDSGWLTASPGQPLAADIRLNRYEGKTYADGIVTGRVTGPGGEPVPGATLTLIRGSRTVATATSNEQGFYRFTGVPATRGDDVTPGTGYILRVEAEGYYPTDLPVAEGGQPVGLLEVQEKSVARADFELYPARGRIDGQVLDALGRPVAGARVELRRAGEGLVAETATDAAGRYRFLDLEAPGGVTYLTSATAGGYYESALGADGAPLEPVDPAGWPGGRAPLDLVLHPASGQLQGAVADTRGQPLAGVPVTAIRPADGATWKATTSSDGWYVMTGLPAGPGDTLLVRADAPEAPPAAALQAVALNGNRAATAHVTAAPAAAVAGTVYGAGGLVLAGATVELWQEGWAEPVARTTTAADGTYRFTGLLAGRRYAVTASAPGYRPSSLSPAEPVVTPLFTAEAGGTIHRPLGLVPEVR